MRHKRATDWQKQTDGETAARAIVGDVAGQRRGSGVNEKAQHKWDLKRETAGEHTTPERSG